MFENFLRPPLKLLGAHGQSFLNGHNLLPSRLWPIILHPWGKKWKSPPTAGLTATSPFIQSLTTRHGYGSLIRSHTISTDYGHPPSPLVISLANGAILGSNAGFKGNPFQLT
jgi:hypothetical protein